jgi:hypothetical protein
MGMARPSRTNHELFKWLTAYAAYLELLCIGVLAGNKGVSRCMWMSAFRSRYAQLVPEGSASAWQLAVAHRRVIDVLVQLREVPIASSHAAALRNELRQHRQAHTAALDRIAQSLVTLEGEHHAGGDHGEQ